MEPVDRNALLAAMDEQVARFERIAAHAARFASASVYTDSWTVRELMCHLAVYYPEREVADQMRRLRRTVEPGRMSPRPGFDIDAANEERIRAYDDVALPDVLDVVRRGRKAIRAAVAELEPDFLEHLVDGTPWGDRIPVRRIVAESTYVHDRGHLDEVEAAILKLDPSIAAGAAGSQPPRAGA